VAHETPLHALAQTPVMASACVETQLVDRHSLLLPQSMPSGAPLPFCAEDAAAAQAGSG
jgi:hypothetical protein